MKPKYTSIDSAPVLVEDYIIQNLPFKAIIFLKTAFKKPKSLKSYIWKGRFNDKSNKNLQINREITDGN